MCGAKEGAPGEPFPPSLFCESNHLIREKAEGGGRAFQEGGRYISTNTTKGGESPMMVREKGGCGKWKVLGKYTAFRGGNDVSRTMLHSNRGLSAAEHFRAVQ